jgi:tetratricopeptide (TPR) repeat protein/DNA-binding CsgD family transcriptional regulator
MKCWFAYLCIENKISNMLQFSKLPLIILVFGIFGNSISGFSQSSQAEEQIIFFNNKCKSFWESSLDSSLYYGNRAIALLDVVKNQEEASKSHLFMGVALFYQSQYDRSIQHLKKGLEIAQKGNSAWAEGFANNMLCILYRNKAEYKIALEYGLKTVEIRKKMKDTINLAGAYQNLSNIYSITGDPQTAIDYLSKSMELHTNLKDTLSLSQVQGTIANLYIDMGENLKAEKLLLKAMSLTPKNTVDYADFSLNLGTIYQIHYLDYAKAETSYLNALRIYESIGIENGLGMAYENLGELKLEQNKLTQAIEYLKLAEYKYEKNQDSTQIAHVKLSIGNFYLKTEKLDSAQIFLHQAVDMGRTRKYSKVVSEGLYLLYKLYKQKGELKPSLGYYEQYSQYKDSLQKELIDNRFAYWDNQMKSLENEQEIEQLKYDKERLKWRASRYYFMLLLMFVVLFSGIIIYYIKRKKDRQLAEKKRAILEREKKIVEVELDSKKLKEKELEQELEFKSKQLSTHALHMMQKNKMLQEVKTQMEEMINHSKIENKPDLRKINRLLDNNIKTDKEWKLFKLYFEELNNEFFNKLKLINANLSQNELKMCALTKLGFNLKETSSLLNVSINTIKNARYRLKLKLGIGKDDSLKEFIDKLE